MDVTVVGCDWGGALRSDVQALLSDVASHLTGALTAPPLGSIVVKATASVDAVPITLYRSCPEEPFTVLLSARGRYWSQFAYQFSHELCHVLSDYERLRESRNKWFHEALCELASVFTLRRMAEAWLSQPPYPGWAGYAHSLRAYADSLLAQEQRRLPAGISISSWLVSEEESLREDSLQRDKNAVVAYSLLPLFENDPATWNSVRILPESSSMFGEYLLEWHARVEPSDRPLVMRIVEAFA